MILNDAEISGGFSIKNFWEENKKLSLISIGFTLVLLLEAVAIYGLLHDRATLKSALMELSKTNQSLAETTSQLKKESPAGRAPIKSGGNTSSLARTPSFVPVEAGQGFSKVATLKDDSYIPRGAVFRARLITSVKTSLQESFVIAETTHRFEMDSKRRIEKGSRLIGSASMDRVLKGVVVHFDTLVTPTGTQYDDLSLLALSDQAFPLIDGLYFSDAGTKYGTALAFGFLSGFSSAGMEREPTLAGSVAKPSVTNQALGGLSVASFKIADEAMDSLKDASVEHVIVPSGTDIYIAFTKKWSMQKTEKGN